jgi:voltage-gated potassium channel
MSSAPDVVGKHGNAYNIFILVLTLFSLLLMVLQLLPLTQAELDLLLVYDNVVCIIFLLDFATNLARAKPKRAYFIGERGWLDLLGSIPTLGFLQATALFRLARLSRLARITKLLRGQAGKDLVIDVLANRSQYATFITILLAGMVLSLASLIVLEVESRSPDANITTGGDALWWGLVTITTVGYGDFFPVTTIGRLTGAFVMFAGIGIIGALASILASLLVSPASSEPAIDAEPRTLVVPEKGQTIVATTELDAIRAELAALRASLDRGGEPGRTEPSTR